MCSVEGCDGAVFSTGMCCKHYNRMRRKGYVELDHDPNRGCLVSGCTKKHDAHGYCSLHRQRWERFGDPLRENVLTDDGEPQKFIELALASNTDDCIFWPFSRDHLGYAKIAVLCEDGKWRPRRVQRIVCQHVHGKPTKKRNDSAHSCGNGHLGCINPRHLRWLTHKENLAEGRKSKEIRS
jgi:hypothetical protein